MDTTYSVARIGPLFAPPRTRHTIRTGPDQDEEMPQAEGVLREVTSEGYAQLYRYTAEGNFAGDTWHATVADADHQLEFEFGGAAGAWTAVPTGIQDPHAYLIEWLQRQLPPSASLPPI